ncbi:hypothetical protein K431DRAFT_168411 [Polychaeton citri CBS 116435]|uniref:Uncharacterized protein n=1 Tax=Polychaeton citri CBS 116435 TaxID=1314669 RepID=A0A9P4PXX2_9PEZI|nr:hypothetical protein K431DRAFT_168411 [Polychaeton citri CBS 116435]
MDVMALRIPCTSNGQHYSPDNFRFGGICHCSLSFRARTYTNAPIHNEFPSSGPPSQYELQYGDGHGPAVSIVMGSLVITHETPHDTFNEAFTVSSSDISSLSSLFQTLLDVSEPFLSLDTGESWILSFVNALTAPPATPELFENVASSMTQYIRSGPN